MNRKADASQISGLKMENSLWSNVTLETLTFPTSTETLIFLKNNSLLGKLAKAEKNIRFKSNG